MDYQYQSVNEKPVPGDKGTIKNGPLKIAIHFICLLWLGPIITLLYLNFSNHIIGPSLWCPLGKCSIYDDDGDYLVSKASRNDHRDHNVNGVLQFASKGLEVWYVFVAGLLIYEAQQVLRKSHRGLPEKYSLTHLEFSDLLNLLNIRKWTRPIRHPRRSPGLCAFVLLACSMTLLVNLMGPSTAVLIIPTVQSIDKPHNASERFIRMKSHEPPAFKDGSGLFGCDAETLNRHLYSCAEHNRGSELDTMISSVVASLRYPQSIGGETDSALLAESQEDGVRFLAYNWTYNKKKHADDFIVPSRHIIRMVSADIAEVIDSDLIDKSLQVSSQRDGPAIAISSLNYNEGDITTIPLGDNKSVTCLSGWMTDQDDGNVDETEYTKCIRNGTGWNSISSQAGFSIRNTSKSDTEADSKLEALVYFSDKATYYGPGLNRDAHEVACLKGNLSAPCDWDNIFSPAKVNGSDFKGSFSNTTIIEWFLPGIGPHYRIWMEFVSYLKFGLYSVDLSVGNEMLFAHLISGEPELDDQLAINPLWILAAWSVDVDGTVDAARFPTFLPGGTNYTSDIYDSDDSDDGPSEFFLLNVFAITQAMSLISYESVLLHGSSVCDKNDPKVLCWWATRRLWAYRLGSRTSWLGVVVVCAGMATVVFRVIFAVFYSRTIDDA
ncbi:hypothetical protein MMC22_010595 [Lobaria immixta]|nr:hypothetical protein [Lobaria immixta]